ncbi:MAG: SurA N-terminal domain-containing protein [Bacteroidaceae bacterium]|nr:SurA N-terminal domain-containing protein [Bacteroidaceae bacterium]
MAALQSIRKHGAILIGAIGLALFAFIAEEFFRSLETNSAVSKQQAGSVYGEKLSIQEYQQYVEEATEMLKMQQGVENLTEEQQQQVRDQVWQTYVQNKIIEHEAKKAGLSVSDEEVQNALVQGTASSLRQFVPFVNQQTGRFDYTGLQNFFTEVKKMQGTQMAAEQMEQVEMIKRMWGSTERALRAELLGQKYQALLMCSFIGNDEAAKEFMTAANSNATALVASIPASTITDKEAKASDSDIQEVYDELKEATYVDRETRDIKFIDVQVQASKADRDALDKKMAETYERIISGEDLAAVVGAANSEVRYVNAPLTKDAFPRDIAMMLDSISAGSTKAPYLNPQDNTLNIIRLVSKQQLSDSILVRSLGVGGDTEEKNLQRADSILNALKGGAAFKAMAQKYGQNGDSVWVSSAQLQQGIIDETGAKYISLLNTAGVGEYQKLEANGAQIIIQVLDRKGSVEKYNAAVVKVPIDFSKDTYSTELNKFNRFIAANKTLADVEKNVGKAGYVMRDLENFTSDASNIGGVSDVKEAIKWIFDEAEKGDISKLYECGQQKDHLLLVAVAEVHKKGYRDLNDKNWKSTFTALANSRVKSEAAYKKLAGVKTIAEAQKKGAVVDTLSNVSFFNTPFVPKVGVPEPAISGAVAKLKQGQTATVKGGNGAYVVQVLKTEKAEQQMDAQNAKMQAAQMQMQTSFQSLMPVLLRKAKVVDNRYKF